MTTTRLPSRPMTVIRLRLNADALALLADDMAQITEDPWPQHAAELRGAVVLLREWAHAISTEQDA